jgi:Putative MetA-pathway of phenol degradation
MRASYVRGGCRAASRRVPRRVISGLIGSLLALRMESNRTTAIAQELEPGAYAVAPVGVNVFVVSNSFNFGDIAFDPAAPLDDARAKINNTVLGYGRTLNVGGRSAQVSIGVPITAGHVAATYLGTPAEVTRFGQADPRARFGINLYGAPAMNLKQFAGARLARLIGFSLTVGLPLGRYSSDRLINLGGHRWAFKPEVGFTQKLGRWVIDTYAGVWLFTTNERFFGNSVRTQAPITSLQFHAQYAITPRLALSGNTNFYVGGRTTINGRRNFDLQRNSRVGATLISPMSKGRTLRLALSRGAFTTIGADFTSVSFSFQKTWGVVR